MSDDGILVHPIQKVTALITRDAATGRELLIFRRPDDGTIQVPAGTVEDGEPPDDAVLRETAEETGLTAVRVIAKLAVETVPLSHNARLLMTDQLLRSTPTSPAVFSSAQRASAKTSTCSSATASRMATPNIRSRFYAARPQCARCSRIATAEAAGAARVP